MAAPLAFSLAPAGGRGVDGSLLFVLDGRVRTAVLAVGFAIESFWTWAALCAVAWISLRFLTRWNRLHIDSKDALNEYENV